MPLKVKSRSVLLVLAALLAALGVARGGHELPVYPSYYPHEIAIDAMPPERAADLLGDAKIQAYLGTEPRFPGAVPASLRAPHSNSRLRSPPTAKPMFPSRSSYITPRPACTHSLFPGY